MQKQDYMFGEVELYISSEQTQKEFSKDKDYTVGSFKYWLSKYRSLKEESTSEKITKHISESFQEIRLTETSSSKLLAEVSTENGVHIKIYH